MSVSGGPDIVQDGLVMVVARGGVALAQIYTAPWRIGGGAVSGYPNITNGTFQGYIGNASVYHRALSPQEVLQNFNAQRSRFGV